MLETETYILFMGWTVLGLFYFRRILKKDHARRFGKADYEPGEDMNFHSVFEHADALMYEEKKRLKALGAVTRE